MKKQHYLCVDLTTFTEKGGVPEYKDASGKLLHDEADHFTFVETRPRVHTPHPDLHWHLLDSTSHGKASINARHVKVEFYIRHEDYADSSHLADMLTDEMEHIADTLSEMNMTDEIIKCVK